MQILFLNLNQKEILNSCKKKFWIFFTLLIFLPGLNVIYGIENQSTGIAANSSILVVWQENTGLGTEIKASALPFGSHSWETPVILSSSSMASLPILAVTDNGSDTFAVAIWAEVIAGTTHLYGAMRPSLMGSWTASVLISDGTEDVIGNYQLLLNSTGNIVAKWASYEAGNLNLRSSTAIINLANTWGVPTTINF
ncbi:MAG: hypothetical protein LW832_04505 [Parachlamydia sp.]|jgi:hypothetical protein|nr:hypothetical protein [Parachlamydia sp.]